MRAKTDRQQGYAKPLYWYIGVVVALGGPVAGFGIINTFRQAEAEWLLLAVAAIGTSLLALRIPVSKGAIGNVTISITDGFVFLALLLTGPAQAVAIACIDALVSCARAGAKKPILYLFNVSQISIVAFSVAFLFNSLGDAPASPDAGISGPLLLGVRLLACALVYFALNSALVAVFGALRNQTAIASLWKDETLWLAPTGLLNAAAALVLAVGNLSALPIIAAALLLTVSFLYPRRRSSS